MKLTDLHSLFVHELKDLLNAELQLLKALPGLARAASHERLRAAIEQHLEETKVHADRLKTILSTLGESAVPERCPAMEGLIKEGAELLENGADADPSVLDAGIIAAAQRVEHYEIAGYGCARAFARLLGNTEAVNLLQATLEEEVVANAHLTEIAENHVNPRAVAHAKGQ